MRTRSWENLKAGKKIYFDEIDWRFYEGGTGYVESAQRVKIEFVKAEDYKYHTVILSVKDESGGWFSLRMDPTQFARLNEMFKTAMQRSKRRT